MVTTQKSYYDILGVGESASEDEIKKAFHKLARTHHPDAGGSEERFKDINEAYETLSDTEKRREYDQMLRYGGMAGMPGRGAPGAWGRAGESGFPRGGRVQQTWTNVREGGGWADIFDSIRNGEGAFGTEWDIPTRPVKGRDVQVTLDISFEEAYRGATKRVTVRVPDGEEKETFEVKVPAGAVEGGRLRYRGRGGYGSSGAERGDLLISFSIKKHALYSRKGADVLLDLPVSFAELALGADIVVPAPDDTMVKLRIPAGTQDGKVFVINGKGAPHVDKKGNGALRVRVVLAVPSELNAQQREALEAFRAASDPTGADIRPAIAGKTAKATAKLRKQGKDGVGGVSGKAAGGSADGASGKASGKSSGKSSNADSAKASTKASGKAATRKSGDA